MQQVIQSILSILRSDYNSDYTPELTVAPKPELGEYCINVFPLAKTAGKAPNLIAEEIASKLAKSNDIFSSTSATGGYVNFFLTDAVWSDIFKQLSQQGAKEGEGKTIIVDYIGANVGKPLHIGHICTPSVGQAICNIHRHIGYTVIGDSHFGDWGGIFGKLIYVWNDDEYWHDLANIEGINFFGSTEAFTKYQLWDIYDAAQKKMLKQDLLNRKGVDLLLNMYQSGFKITVVHGSNPELIQNKQKIKDEGSMKEFQYLSGVGIDLTIPEELNHHEENVELWKKFTSISITESEKKLDLLNVHATYNIGESFYEGLGLPRPNGEDYPPLKETMKDIVRELVDKGIAVDNSIATNGEDKSVGVVFPEDTKMPSCVLQKKDGTGLYLTSDLAAIKYRLTNGWNPQKLIYSVDVRQQLHLKQAFWIAKQAWPELTKDVEFFHAFNGFIKLKEGAMSTRHGTVIFLEALIEEGNVRTQEILAEKGRTGDKSLKKEDIQAITVGAIKYSYLTQDREKDVVFDWDKALNFEGHSGPYIQYAYVRANKIIDGFDNFRSFINENLIFSSYDKSLIQALARMDEVIANTAKTYKPHYLALYAYDLAVCFNSFYVHTPKILEETNESLKNFRLSLVSSTANTLHTVFKLLGIEMPTEM